MSVRLRFALAVALLLAYVVGGVALALVALSGDLRAGERALLERVLEREASLLVFALVLFGLGLAALASALFRSYMETPRRLARETELIAGANPSHRVEPRGPAELRVLAAAINALAARSETGREDVERQIALARADLEEERNRLAVLMSELTLAVLVCNGEGRILLYNAAAKELLSGDEGGRGPVGLGRSIFGILDRSLVAHALERIRAGAAGEAAPAAVHLTAALSDERLLRIGVAPVADRDGELTGFLLILDDVTRAAHESARRERRLRVLTEGTRAAVGNIRAAIESLLEYPDMDPAERGRFVVIIREEALRLSERVGEALAEGDGEPGAGWLRAEMLGRDLAAAARVALERDAALTVDEELADEELWLRVDSYALVQALVHLARRVREETGAERFALRLSGSGRHARLDLVWRGRALHEETLRRLAAEALEGGAVTAGRVIGEHGGELWGQAEDDGASARLRLLLPLAEPVEPARPARRRAAEPERRPEFYDFDLFRAGERAAEWDAAPLDTLPCTVFDTETTGLSPTEDELISIGAVRLVNGRLLRGESFEQLIDPGRPVPPGSQAIHGISTEMLQGQPRIEQVLPRFARFAEDTLLVGHNIAFDLRFFELEEGRTGVRFDAPVLDTLLLSGVVHPDEQDHSLEAMAARLGLSVVGRHTALGDAMLTGEILLKQVRLLRARGLVTLGEVREAARRTYLARVSDSLYSRD